MNLSFFEKNPFRKFIIYLAGKQNDITKIESQIGYDGIKLDAKVIKENKDNKDSREFVRKSFLNYLKRSK